MGNKVIIKSKKKSLNAALRALFKGYKLHKKYSDVYVISFSVNASGTVKASVPGGEYTFEAETEGYGSFSVSYKWFRMFVKDCKLKQIYMEVENDVLRLNNTASIKVKYTEGDISVPLSIFYTPGEILRVDWSAINDEIVGFWNLKTQIEDANDHVDDVINAVYIKLAGYLPPKTTESGFKSQIKNMIFGGSKC